MGDSRPEPGNGGEPPPEEFEPAVRPEDEVEDEPEPKQAEQAGGELGEFIKEYLKLSAIPEKQRDDDYAKAERACRERINSRYWNRLFSRLAKVVAGSAPDSLDFTAADGRLFDFGWVDERLFPAGKLIYDQGFTDEVYDIRDLRAHLAATDAELLLVEQRRRLAEGVATARAKVEELGRQITDGSAERGRAAAELPEAIRLQMVELDKFIDGSTVALTTLERRKRSKGLAGDQVRGYGKLRVAYDDAVRKRDRLLKRAGAGAKPISGINKRLYDSKVAAVLLVEKIEQLGAVLKATETEAEARRARRRAELEERLGEIREDITMCGRWGRTTASPALLQNRGLNSKDAVVEAIRRVEDFDPGIFANRKVEREGRPKVVLTPGIGNGSYDFRSNILIVPRTSPRSTLQSVAFALALYRRDQDKSSGEGKLWRSFLEDIAWSKIGGVPRSVQAQMRAFVRAYTNWATREAAGHSVLAPEIRGWYEQNIAPSTRGPIMPRHVRGLAASSRDALLIESEPAARTAEEVYALGCLYWMKDDFARDMHWFDRAAELDPEFAPAYWAEAACYRLPAENLKLEMGTPQRLTKAKESLGKFVAIAEQSWWTRQAQHISGELQAKLEEMRRATR